MAMDLRPIDQAMQLRGLTAVPYDIRYNPQLMDICTDAGFLHALTLALQCKDKKGRRKMWSSFARGFEAPVKR